MNFSNTKDMMNISMSELAVLLSAFGVLVAALSLLFTVTSFRKQLQLNFFADYTKRYQEILLNFPGSINEADFDIENFSPESRDKILRYMRAYFDLCSEEYYLWKQGNLDDKTWREWETGIKFAFSKPAFSQAWSMLQLDTIYYGAFSYYVKGVVSDRK